RNRLPAPNLRPDSGERVGGPESFVGLVEDFPIHKLTAAAQSKAPCRDTAQRKRNHAQLPSVKLPWIARIGMRMVHFLRYVSCLPMHKRRPILGLRGGTHRAGRLPQKIAAIEPDFLRHGASLS